MTGGGCLSSPAPASLPEDDDLLSEFLLRLPPTPSSLPRAALVSKRWRRLVSDPAFLRRFRARHRRSAPCLGFFVSKGRSGLSFMPTLEPPDRVPSTCFTFLLDCFHDCQILCCRHGLVLILLPTRLLVWDPSTGDAAVIPVPWGFDSRTRTAIFNGAVLRAAGDANGDEDSGHFRVVVVSTDDECTQAFACVFSSETGEWGNPISTACPSMSPTVTPGTLVGRSLYWALDGASHGILEFDLDKQCLSVIDVTLFLSDVVHYRIWVMPVEGGVVGYLFYSIDHKFELWKKSADCDTFAGWVLERSFELGEFLEQSSYGGEPVAIVGIDEDKNVFFLHTKSGVFVVHMESMQCKKVSEIGEMPEISASFLNVSCHSFSSVYTSGLGIDDGDARDDGEDGDEPLH